MEREEMSERLEERNRYARNKDTERIMTKRNILL